MQENHNLDFYFYYLIIGVVLTGMLGAFLFWQGGKFLMDAFQKDENFARRTNSMLLVLFLLFNLCYIFLNASPGVGVEIKTGLHLFEKLVFRIGIFIGVLSAEYAITLAALYVIRRSRKARTHESAELYEPHAIQLPAPSEE